ncbi:hypothetical protein FKP32DRAFT_233379 [Trametes sanguinea]|nr:hypothetical protein FKP32DRAFT_233379 [Trametes sanguinea]
MSSTPRPRVDEDPRAEPSHTPSLDHSSTHSSRVNNLNSTHATGSGRRAAAEASSSSWCDHRAVLRRGRRSSKRSRSEQRWANQRSDMEEDDDFEGTVSVARTEESKTRLGVKRRRLAALDPDAVHLGFSTLSLQSASSQLANPERPGPSSRHPAPATSARSVVEGPMSSPNHSLHRLDTGFRNYEGSRSHSLVARPETPKQHDRDSQSARLVPSDALIPACRSSSPPSQRAPGVVDKHDNIDILDASIHDDAQAIRSPDPAPNASAKPASQSEAITSPSPVASIPHPISEPCSSLSAPRSSAVPSHSNAVDRPLENLQISPVKSDESQALMNTTPCAAAVDSKAPVADKQGCGVRDDPIVVEEYQPRMRNPKDEVIDLTMDE